MAQSILVVEDEPDILALVCLHLKHAGFTCLAHGSAESAQKALLEHKVDVAIIDWMLPSQSGTELIKQIRRTNNLQGLPILMLTARGSEGDKLTGFHAGTDDYLVKPFSPRELIARIQALLRRSGHRAEAVLYRFKGLQLDSLAMRVQIEQAVGNQVELTDLPLSPTEYRLILNFLKHPDRVLSREALLDKVWTNQTDIDSRTVDVHIRRLRLALKPFDYENMIETVRGGGYRLAKVSS